MSDCTKGHASIVIVDDDDDTSEQLAEVFRSEGWTTTTIGSALGALDLVKRARADLVILEVALPFRSGASLLGSLKADPELATVPVVVYSASTDTLTSERRAVAAAVVQKPADEKHLVDVVRAVLAGTNSQKPSGHRDTAASGR